MASLKDRCVQINQAIVLTEAQQNFSFLAAALQTDKGVAITIEDSYLSKYDVTDQLRKLTKDKTVKPPEDIKPLFDETKTITSIVQEGKYDALEGYINGLNDNDFEPPILPDFKSPSSIDVKELPNKSSKDPRRTGRLVKPGPSDALKSLEVQKWLINNSAFYGYVPYSDNALYYIGVDQIKNEIKSAGDKQGKLKEIVGRFLKSGSILSMLTLTAQQVLDNKLPSAGNFPDPGNLEVIPNHSLPTNDNRILELVVVDNQPVWKPVALAFLAMKQAAQSAGINLRISSGFRPAYGPNLTATTTKGRQITVTTQETLRRDRSRWVQSVRSQYGSDDDFVFKAPSSGYSAETAKPGASNHGSGVAIDLNVGGRTKFSPLNEANYVWLIKNGWKYGFVRTVKSEEWHFEYIPEAANSAKGPYFKVSGANGDNRFYSDLGLNQGAFPIA